MTTSQNPQRQDFRQESRRSRYPHRLGPLLVAWCFQIVQPFIVPVVWGIIIAVAVHPLYRRLETALGNRRAIAATLFTLLMLILLIGPTVMLAGTLAESAQRLAADLTDGTLSIPGAAGERPQLAGRRRAAGAVLALGLRQPCWCSGRDPDPR